VFATYVVGGLQKNCSTTTTVQKKEKTHFINSIVSVCVFATVVVSGLQQKNHSVCIIKMPSAKSCESAN
jgi:hypothetical protein